MFQTPGLEHLLRILAGELGNYTGYLPVRDTPSPVLKLYRRVVDAANGTYNLPPRMQVSTAYGVLTLEAKWLVPAGTLPADAARDPKSCLISVTIELHEHPNAHAARVLRESGATPAQTKVGIQLALGKPKPVFAEELGLQLASVMATTKELYQNLDIHNSAELAKKNLAGPKTRRGAPIFAARRIDRGPNFLFRACPVDVSMPRTNARHRLHRPCPCIATFAALANRPASGGTETPAGRRFCSAPPRRPSRPLCA